MDVKRKSELFIDWDYVRTTILNTNSIFAKQFINESDQFKLANDKNCVHLKEYFGYKQAAHAFIWALNDMKLWGHDSKASVVMQMRFDGFIGFPGGLIDPDDKTIEDGLNREMKEEMNLSEKYYLSESDYLMTHIYEKRKIILHFYVKSVNYKEFKEIEISCLNSKDWGGEVMGIIRPPLHKIYHDKYAGGLPRFIHNKFVGNALSQFLIGLLVTNIMSKEEIIEVLTNNGV